MPFGLMLGSKVISKSKSIENVSIRHIFFFFHFGHNFDTFIDYNEVEENRYRTFKILKIKLHIYNTFEKVYNHN